MRAILESIMSLNREAFYIPLIDLPIYWYGLLFAFGFYASVTCTIYLVASRVKAPQHQSLESIKSLVNAAASYFILAIIVGARVFHVAFYEGWQTLFNLRFLLSIRDGGLASHGAIIMILVAFAVFMRVHGKRLQQLQLPALSFLDAICHSSMIAAVFIRLGNFMNQEIIGKATQSGWGVVLPNPLVACEAVPRHPVVLYEAAFYFLLFLTLFPLMRISIVKRIPGMLSAIFFVLLFSFRMAIEPFKESQSVYDTSLFSMGQMLSVPLLFFGVGMMIWLIYRQKNVSAAS